MFWTIVFAVITAVLIMRYWSVILAGALWLIANFAKVIHSWFKSNSEVVFGILKLAVGVGVVFAIVGINSYYTDLKNAKNQDLQKCLASVEIQYGSNLNSTQQSSSQVDRSATGKRTATQFGADLKEKYPQYSQLSDIAVGLRGLETYPEYKDYVKLATVEEIVTGVRANDTQSVFVNYTDDEIIKKILERNPEYKKWIDFDTNIYTDTNSNIDLRQNAIDNCNAQYK